MPQASPFEAPQGSTIYGELFSSITEAFVGNGIQNNGDGEVTSDPNADMGIVVSSASGVRYGGSSYDVDETTFVIGESPTTSTNGQNDRRADLVVFDSSTASYDVISGTPAPNPRPPSTPDDALLLSIITIDHDVDSIVDEDIANWRAHAAVDFPVVDEDIDDSVSTTITVQDDGKTIEPEAEIINFGSGIDVASTGAGSVEVSVDPSILDADEPLAQALSRRGNDPSATRIESASGVTARKAQVLARRA